jgi:membrane protease YdiL (CAAX protease family)
MPWRYFALTFAYSWGLWLAALCLGEPVDAFPVGILYLLGGLGPSVGSLLLLLGEGGWKSAVSLLRRVLDFGSMGVRGFSLVVAVSVLPNLFAVLLTEGGASGLFAMDLSYVRSLPWIGFLLVVAVVEEVGWRGYALPRLLEEHSKLASSLVLGFIWALWHFPLFLIPGTWQSGLGFATPAFWRYLLQILPRSVIYTWIYVRNCGSLSSAVAAHALINMSGELFDVTSRADTARMILETALAALLLRV